MNITANDFTEFVRTRHAMWLEKSYGVPAEEWLTDTAYLELMRGHRYTNVWRELDRGTLEVTQIQESFDTTTYKVLHTMLYRFFNSRNGYDRLIQLLLETTPHQLTGLADLTDAQIDSVLDKTGNFSGAYIRTIKRSIARNAIREMPIHASRIADLLEDYVCLDNMVGHGANVTAELSTWAKLENVRIKIRAAFGEVPSFGNFLADQLMLDFCGQGNQWGLRFTPDLGPGAKRGLERAGMTFQESIDAGAIGVAVMPVPHVLYKDADAVKTNTDAVTVHTVKSDAVTFGAVEAEHQLCEAEKLWKLMDAAEEGTGRKVKMRKYDAVAPHGILVRSILPDNWYMPSGANLVQVMR